MRFLPRFFFWKISKTVVTRQFSPVPFLNKEGMKFSKKKKKNSSGGRLLICKESLRKRKWGKKNTKTFRGNENFSFSFPHILTLRKGCFFLNIF